MDINANFIPLVSNKMLNYRVLTLFLSNISDFPTKSYLCGALGCTFDKKTALFV